MPLFPPTNHPAMGERKKRGDTPDSFSPPGRMLLRWLLAGLAPLLLTGCELTTVQSMLDPAGPSAVEIDFLWWLMLGLGTTVFLVVMGLFAFAIFRERLSGEEAAPPLGENTFIVLGGIVVPVIILIVLLIFSLDTQATLQTPEGNLTVRVVGHQWWWEVHYPDHDITLANEIHIPTDQPVRLELIAEDVIHSFWVPRLGGKRDLLPGMTNIFWTEASAPGVYRGQCAEYCGLQHANMAFRVVAHESGDFEAWLADKQTPPPEPDTPMLQQGQQTFMTACGHCHAIEGTDANARVGPDLTHLASRLTIGAGTLENNRGNLAGWIINPQSLKPGNLMPPSHLSSAELQALLSYLETLE